MYYYLGLDNGGTATKAALYSQRGEEIAVAAQETKALLPKPGFVERDMEEMWSANCQVIHSVLDQSGIAPSAIRAVAVCGHGKGLYLWGKGGSPVRPGIISTDNRAYSYPVRWRKEGIEEKLFPVTCQHILACQPVSLLAWLKDHEPETIGKIQWIFGAKDYIRFRLTGNAQAELTDVSGSGFLNLHTQDYDPYILEELDLQEIRPALPPLCKSLDLCGTVTAAAADACGLAEGTAVVGGMFDIDACMLTANVVDEDRVCMIAGTWSINEYLRTAPVMDGSVRMNSLSAIPGYYLIEESSPTSAGNNEWFIQTLLTELLQACTKTGSSIYDQMNQWVESIPLEEMCPIFLPFLMASNVHPNAKGCLIGLERHHTRAHLARSIYEGIAFGHRMHLERLLQSRISAPKSIRLAGGAARSAVWSQMFADVMGFSVETVSARETGTLGCAIATAAAVGQYKNVAQAAKNMSRITCVYLPSQRRHDIYEKKYQMYKQAIESLDGMWDAYQVLEETLINEAGKSKLM